MMKRLLVAGFSLLAQSVYAQSLGTLGQTFPVLEKSLLVLIQERLTTFAADGTLATLENQWVKRVEDKAIRPTPLLLTRAERSHTHYYTPVAILNQDIKDARGRILLNRGMSVNALRQLPGYEPIWVFVNFDDEAQRRYADALLKSKPSIKWILTGGNVVDAQKRLNQPVYFDQAGRITQKLGIVHVPTLVTRDNDSLKIQELAIREDGHAL